MPVDNREIADLFDELADLLEIEDANPFRVRAYRNAAARIRSDSRSMADLVHAGEDLSRLPDIGTDLAEKIATLVETGKLPLLEEVESRTPAALSDLMKIEGLGAKRVKALYRELNVCSIDDLKLAARSGKIRKLEGFGEKTERRILERAEAFKGAERRLKLVDAERIAEPLVDYLQNCTGVKRVVIAGSFRRRKETVGDLDILVTAARDSAVMERFVEYEHVSDVISKGDTRATVRLGSGISVDLRVVPQTSYGAALVYFTGSREHNIELRKEAVGKKLKINEYGVFSGEQRVAGRTEKSVYATLDLPEIPPELRENRGELDAARNGELPHLIRLRDIRGDLNCHTASSDGRDEIRAMAEAAAERGYEYLSINDRSRDSHFTNGLDERHLNAQVEEIDRVNAELDNIVILKSIELDILEDGSLSLPDSVLATLNLTVCAMHDRFGLSREKQTERILRAMDNRFLDILALPDPARNEQLGDIVDLERIMETARKRGCALELNAHPDRMNLSDAACKMATEMGVRIAVSTGARRTSDLDLMRFGIDQARRGWAEKADVINALPVAKLARAFGR